MTTVTNKGTFGEYVKDARLQAGLSLKQLEEQTGIPSSYLNRLEKEERDNCSTRIFIQIVTALKLPVIEALTYFGYES